MWPEALLQQHCYGRCGRAEVECRCGGRRDGDGVTIAAASETINCLTRKSGQKIAPTIPQENQARKSLQKSCIVFQQNRHSKAFRPPGGRSPLAWPIQGTANRERSIKHHLASSSCLFYLHTDYVWYAHATHPLPLVVGWKPRQGQHHQHPAATLLFIDRLPAPCPPCTLPWPRPRSARSQSQIDRWIDHMTNPSTTTTSRPPPARCVSSPGCTSPPVVVYA